MWDIWGGWTTAGDVLLWCCCGPWLGCRGCSSVILLISLLKRDTICTVRSFSLYLTWCSEVVSVGSSGCYLHVPGKEPCHYGITECLRSGLMEVTSLLRQGHPERIAQDHVQTSFEYLQVGRLRSLSGQPVAFYEKHWSIPCPLLWQLGAHYVVTPAATVHLLAVAWWLEGWYSSYQH